MLERDEAGRVGAAYGKGLATFDWSLIEQIYAATGDRYEVDRRIAFEQEYGGMLREYERITEFGCGMKATRSPEVKENHRKLKQLSAPVLRGKRPAPHED